VAAGEALMQLSPDELERTRLAYASSAGNLADAARRLGISRSTMQNRARLIGVDVAQPSVRVDHPGRLDFEIRDGTFIIGSDHHYWPGIVTTAHRGFVHLCKELKPKGVCANGDVLDGSSISRHPPIGWETSPSLIEEVETCKDRLGEITTAAGKAKRFWTLGNHDARFETRLATVAPQYAKIHGVHLKDHFVDWQACWMLVINDEIVVKHRYKGGIHATHNNTMWAGKTMVTGHLHSLKVTPFSDYSGTRWGVDTGTMADPYSAPFADYTELSPVNWRSGFVVLTFKDGRLLWPEVCHVIEEGKVEFRGKVIEV
jgi:hypothetical protein